LLTTKNKKINLYIHIPFCQQKCKYCAFFSTSGQKKYFNDYFVALKNEILSYQTKLSNYEIQTVYIGGGTPSLVPVRYIKDLILYLKSHLIIAKDVEITIESNPESLNESKLKQYLSIGINRLSIGVQSFNDNLLKDMGRLYKAEEVIKVVQLAKSVGFKNINIDLIFGLPNQTIQNWRYTLDQAFNLPIQHISCYSLELDNTSVWGNLYSRDKLDVMNDEANRELYKLAKIKSKENKIYQYEISNFAKAGFECRHNLDFWHYQEYIGIGAGAHSFFKNSRFNNIYNIVKYIDSQKQDKNMILNLEKITKNVQMREYLAFGLRLINGIDINIFEEKFEISIKEFAEELEKLVSLNLIIQKKDKFLPTSKGLDLWNIIFIHLM